MSIKKSKKTSSFKGRVSANAKKLTRSGGGYNHLQLPKGVNSLILDEVEKRIKLDFIPYVVNDKKHPDEIAVGDLWYRRPFKLHRSIGADKKNYICLSSIGKRCPICEVQKELFDTDKQAAIALYPKSRVLYAVIPKGSKKHEEVPYVWDMSEALFHDTLKDALEENEDYEIFPDLEEGLTVKCSLKWKSIGDSKPFPEVNHVDFEERNEPYDESILDESPNLDDIIAASVLSYETLKAAFLEIDEEEEGGNLKDDEDDDEPKRTKKPVSNKPSRKVEEDDEDDTEEDDDEPVKKPVSKTSKRKPTSKVEEDEDEDDDEDKEPVKVKKPIATTSKRKPVEENKDEDENDDEPEIPKKERCVACQGTGKNSHGKRCPICNGTGRKPVEEEDDEDDTPVKTPKKKEPLATPNMKTNSPSKGKCPCGHRFGVDAEKFDDCDDCDCWSACADAKEKTNKK
jgi:hypothetical protein